MLKHTTPPAAELPPLYTLSDAARELKISTHLISLRAAAYGVGARTVGGGVRLFTASDLEALRIPTGQRGNRRSR